MGLLNLLFGDDKNLKGPDFSKYYPTSIDFSGIKLSFVDPNHTASYPIDIYPQSWNVFDPNIYRSKDEDCWVYTFYKKGWALVGKGRRGGVDVQGRIFQSMEHSFFNISDVADLLIKSYKWTSDFKNEGERPVEFIYPKSLSEFKTAQINGSGWLIGVSHVLGHPPEIDYAIAIGEHHFLLFTFRLDSYYDIDFYHPSTNLDEAAHRLVEEFMSHVKVELSEQALAEKAEADSRA